MKTMDLKKYGGLDYVKVLHLPLRVSKSVGDIVDIRLRDLELEIANELLRQHVPLRGREVEFLRKVLGLSMERFAAKLGLTSGTILRWERGKDTRLAFVNEYAVRGFVADALGGKVTIKFSDLSDSSKTPERLVVDWRERSRKTAVA
jgi:DNA-binding transcriptional regulator YiaG